MRALRLGQPHAGVQLGRVVDGEAAHAVQLGDRVQVHDADRFGHVPGPIDQLVEGRSDRVGQVLDPVDVGDGAGDEDAGHGGGE